MEYKDLCIEFEVDDAKLISVNDQYMHPVRRTKRGRYVSYFCPSPYLKEVQAFYKEVLDEKISDKDINDFKEVLEDTNFGVKLEISVGIPRADFNRSDVSNFIKAIEDCIVKRTTIDDSKNFSVSINKKTYDNEDKWIIRIRMTVIEKEVWD